jgi:hypothetical protein
MSQDANDVVCSLYDRAADELIRLKKNQAELKSLANAYFRYCSLLEEQSRLRISIITIFGVMGKFFPDVGPETANLISRLPLNSDDVRKKLRLWEVLKLYLETVRRPDTIGRFRSFLGFLDLYEIPNTPQAIDSAIRTHPELFKEIKRGNNRLIEMISPTTPKENS